MNLRKQNRIWLGATAALSITVVLQAALIIKLGREIERGGGKGLFSHISGLFHPDRSQGTASVPKDPADAGGGVLVMGDDIRQIHEEIHSAFDRLFAEVNLGRDEPGGGRGMSAPPGYATAPWQGMRRMQERIDEIFRQSFRMMRAGDMDGILGGGWERISGSSALDIRDRGDYYELTMHLPGKAREDIVLQVDGRLLTVMLAGASGGSGGSGRAVDFRTRVMLPEPILSEKVEAVFDGNVLRVRAPKADARAPNKIVVM